MIDPVQVAPRLQPTRCAICGTLGEATELYPSTITPDAFDARHFSARRSPDRVHYRMVRCNRCGLVRSDPAADPSSVAGLYERSTFDYDAEVPNLRRTYRRYLARLDRHGANRDGLVEIGCGNGFFLEEALARGYRHVKGIEPSRDAIESASEEVRPLIVHDILRPGVLPHGSASVVCMFQVFDHLPDPGAALDELHDLIRPGGLALFLNHDAGAPSARLLGERSPIVDVEHFYLYSQDTLGKLVTAHGFEVLESGFVWNDYTLGYMAHLLPLPRAIKGGLQRSLAATRLATLRTRMPLGNLYLVARRSTLSPRRGEGRGEGL
jgi:SAM-dependent methyltransferase